MAGITLGTNLASLTAQRGLAKATSEVTKAYERLSSGMRINSASDDAAGLSISMALNSSAKVFAQGVRNINDAISATSISESALGSLSGIAQRQVELAEQAANGTYTLKQRRAMNREADALTDEFNRIVQSTDFNGIQLLSTFATALSVQAGYGTNGAIGAFLNTNLARTTGDGTFAAPISVAGTVSLQGVTTGDFNGDGKLDMAAAGGTKIVIRLGNGDGSFTSGATISVAGNDYSLTPADFNGDGNLDLMTPNSVGSGIYVTLGNGDGTFRNSVSYATAASIMRAGAADVNNDGILDVVSLTGTGVSFSVSIGNGDGSFRVGVSTATGILNSDTYTVADFDGDGKIDFAVGDFNTGNLTVHLGNGDGSFRGSITFSTGTGIAGRISAGDLNHDGVADLVLGDTTNSKIYVMSGNGDGTFGSAVSYAASVPIVPTIQDYNGDGYNDIAVGLGSSPALGVLINRGDGTFNPTVSYSIGSGTGNVTAAGDLDGDGALDLVAGTGTSISVLLANPIKRTTIAYLDLFSQSSARASLTIAQGTVTRISQELGAIGAFSSRFGTALRSLESSRENYLGAEGRIKDADIAAESANLIRHQILQQSAAAVLSQANQGSNLALKLLAPR